MLKNFLLIIIFGLIVIVSGACSFLQHKNANESILESSQPELKQDPLLIHGTLKNGFRYYLYKNLYPENRVEVHLDILAGSMNEMENQRGLAHYLEHMLFNGSTHFKPGELVEYFQSIGMDFGADANAHTGFFETVYDLSLPQGNKNNLENALTVIEDYASGASLLKSEIDKERGIILAEKRERDTTSYRTFTASLEFELPESRIIQRHPIGLEKVIKSADQALLKDFYDTWYRPDNMILILAGDFDIPVAEKLIKERFSSLKARGEKRIVPENTFKEHKGVKTFYHFEPEAGNTEVTIETVVNVDFKKQTCESLKTRVKKDIADSIFNNRVSKLLGKNETPFSDIAIYSGVYLRNIAFSSISAESTSDKWQETLSSLETNLQKALIFGFTQKELNRVKAEYIKSLENKFIKSNTRESRHISSSIIYHVNNNKIFQSPKQKLDLLKPFIQSLTIKDINNSFKDTWSKNHRLILVTGNCKIGKNNKQAEKIILSQYNRSREIKITEYQDSKKVDFPYLPEPEKNWKIKRKKEISKLGITTIDYDNSVRLNLKKTKYKKGEFLFNFAVKGGNVTEPETKPGLGIITQDLINESGLGGADKEELNEILAGTSVDIDFNVENGCFSFTGQGGSSEIKLVFELLYSYLKDPGFGQENLKLVKQRYKQGYDALLKTPNGLMHIKGNKFLAGQDRRFGMPEVELINKLTVSDIQQWIKPFFEKAGIEISIVGDFDLKIAQELAGQYFGTLSPRDNTWFNKISNTELKFPKNKKLILNMDTKVKKSEVHITFLTDDFWNISQTRGLNLLTRIFSERFRKIIREELGLAYSAYVYNNPSFVYKNYGVLHAVVKGKPSEIDFVLENMQKITVSLAKKGVTEKELELVKRPVLNKIKDILQTNTYWLNSVLTDSLYHPEQFEWSKNIFNEYSSISSKTISLLAKKFLNLDESAIIIIKPEKL